MIFGSLGLLVVSAVLLAFGIGKSSVGYLVVALLCAGVAGLLIIAAYQAHRARLVAAGGATPSPVGAPAGMPVAGAQPIYFVPIAANGVPIMMATPPTEGNGGTMLAAAAPPVVGYDEMAATQIVKLIQSGALSTDQVLAISRYESMHQARKTVLQAAGVT